MEGKEKWVHVRVFLIVLVLHAAAVFLFTRGFLLTRTELNAYSTCHDSPIQTSSNSTSSCWTPPAVDRLVIVVLDALRFDFVAPSAFFDEKKPWMDKLTVLQKLGSSTSARLFKAIADPPTTSLQRLKGLTTGGLPTFIDVGNSFGAPAIVEDNLIYQLAKNGKRVLMMGDDTWLQLFPDHFDKSYPYPSFNVKDLDTVDDGCIEHLIPSLYKDDWDVLIAHFLGVDHAGHIFGVDSEPMIQKLEQYNSVLEKVIDVLKNNSGPGGLHENTYFIVMGDHGQTINGDHGGGTPEEVETSLFAMSLKSPPTYASSLLPSDFCRLNVDGEKTCVGSMQQIDFAVTIAALLGIPFPFGSIGRVNSELYALSARTWEGTIVKTEESIHTLQAWIENYMNTLRLNCWQVKRYIDLYSATSVLGFSYEDLQHVAELYSMTQITNSSYSMTVDNVSDDDIFLSFKSQISVYSKFLEYVAELARSKWTEFNLTLMGIGLLLLFVSIFFQFYVVTRMYKFCQLACPTMKSSWTARRVAFPILLVAIRGSSFLSNSYILTEGKVANFLLATTAVINLRDELAKGRVLTEDVLFLILNVLLRFSVEGVLSKQVIGSISVNIFSLDNFLKGGLGLPYLMVIFREILPIAFVLLLVPFLYKRISGIPCKKALNIFIIGVTLSHALIALYWTSESSLVEFPATIRNTVKTFVPRAIYSIGCMLVSSAIVQRFQHNQDDFDHSRVISAATSILCAWSPTIMILLGKQGPFVACICILGVWCVIRMQKVSKTCQKDGVVGSLVVDPMSITQWSLLAACLFFYTGHWCNFDGLRYGAAFIGFDQFILLRQAILLAIDTFGASHLLPVLALPILVGLCYKNSVKEDARSIFVSNMTIAFLIFGLEAAITTTFTVVCVTIQRRHLMVWGLFTPKYVFDAIGLLIIDVLIFLSSLYYY